MNKLIKFMLIIVFLIIGLLAGKFTVDYLDKDVEFSDLDYHNACVDGCFNMKEIVVGKLYYENTTHNTEWDINCSNACMNNIIEKANKVA